MLCVFPFEESLYRDAGVPATYVGHPLADVIPLEPDRAAARSALELTSDDEVVALLPGSRQSELSYLADRYVQAAARLKVARPRLRFVVPLASDATREIWRSAVTRHAASSLDVRLAPGKSHAALAACDVALVASGTATLEAALFKRPMVIAYNMAPLSWTLMRRMAYQPWVGLPNILCGEFIVPELLQEDASPDNLAQAVSNLLDDPALRARISARFTRMHVDLRRGMAGRAAGALVDAFFPGHGRA